MILQRTDAHRAEGRDTVSAAGGETVVRSIIGEYVSESPYLKRLSHETDA